MDSLPIGSNKILEIQSGNIHVVIKSKTYHPTITYDVISEENSSIRVTGLDVNSVKIYGDEKIADNGDAVSASSQSFTVYPMEKIVFIIRSSPEFVKAGNSPRQT